MQRYTLFYKIQRKFICASSNNFYYLFFLLSLPLPSLQNQSLRPILAILPYLVALHHSEGLIDASFFADAFRIIDEEQSYGNDVRSCLRSLYPCLLPYSLFYAKANNSHEFSKSRKILTFLTFYGF